MKPKKQTLLWVLSSLTLSLCCLIGGLFWGNTLGNGESEEGNYPNDYTLMLAQRLEEAAWQYDGVEITFSENGMLFVPKGGQAAASATNGTLRQTSQVTVCQYVGGKPKSGAKFTVFNEAGDACATLTTDSYGAAKVFLGAGTYTLKEDGANPTEYSFTVADGAPITVFLSGLETASITVKAGPGLDISIYEGPAVRGEPIASGTTDGEGFLYIRDLVPGEYAIRCQNQDKRVFVYGGDDTLVLFSQ
ncbi:hypothetical protein LJC20_00105 [Eubacteriales bacterium OttesenSCG-928-M02]|nr:hypothetical protein [Eubacteriales bacterium OttesenSCG-928-M02]